MKQRTLNINIPGRVKKVRTTDPFVPLFEAISNTFHATQDLDQDLRKVNVKIVRSSQPQLADETENEKPITGFEIEDNGVGFSEENMDSFCLSDSTHKEKSGGKGVGRFSWLKFFDQAEVTSVFKAGEKKQKRKFIFSMQGVHEENLIEVSSEVSTLIKLQNLKPAYLKFSRKKTQEVAIALIDHFISFFVTGGVPDIVLKDGAETINLREIFDKNIAKDIRTKALKIDNCDFKFTLVKFFRNHIASNIFLCANNRVAETHKISKVNSFFQHKFLETGLNEYWVSVFVEGEFLDDHVNDDRDGLNFPENREPMLVSFPTKLEIIKNASDFAAEILETQISEYKKENFKRVENFVQDEAPQYRTTIKKYHDSVSLIHAKDKTEIDLSLRKLQFEEEQKLALEIANSMRKYEEKSDSSKAEWIEQSKEILSKLNEQSKDSLSHYVIQRKMILELLKRRMELDSDGNYSKEQAIHQLIFPMRTTSEDVNYKDQNLWLIDERLSYHYYLASDKPLSAAPDENLVSKKEPDLIVFNRPIALNDRLESESFESIVIVEFKRPGDLTIDSQKTPVDQILEYIEVIREGKAKTRKGRPIGVTENVYFFGYLICDMTSSLKKLLLRRQMHETPDGKGMFGYFSEHRAYIEVMSYDKMLNDAIKRNRILFEKLSIAVT